MELAFNTLVGSLAVGETRFNLAVSPIENPMREEIMRAAQNSRNWANLYDPNPQSFRIKSMLLERMHVETTSKVQIAPLKVGVVTIRQQEISQQTTWMLSVRDRRDRNAFVLLFDYYAPRLKGFLMKSGTSAEAAEEVIQDVMLTVWRKAAQFDPHKSQVSGWVYQIARNRHIDLLRKTKRPLPEELGEVETEDDASQIIALEQEARQLKRALGRLKQEQREVIERAYLGELTHQEISKETGLPLGTIKSRIRLGLDRLRHELKGMR